MNYAECLDAGHLCIEIWLFADFWFQLGLVFFVIFVTMKLASFAVQTISDLIPFF